MYTVILQELKPYSCIELQELFKVDEKTLKEMLSSLSLMNIVKQLSNDVSKVDFEEFLDIDTIDRLSSQLEGTLYLFKYVGMLAIGHICIIVYPKYITEYQSDAQNNFKLLKQLISVIRKYKSKEQKVGGSDPLSVHNVNLLSIVLELINNYNEYGLYSNNREIIEQNGEGGILWDTTINSSTAYFSNRVPLYLDTFTANHIINEYDYFRRLHAYILTAACSKAEYILNILDMNIVKISSDDLDVFGSKDYIIYRINQELTTQFVTYKQNILKLLKRYIEEDRTTSLLDNISFVGTTSFNLAWEDVCSVVMNDCINKPIKELGLQYTKNKKQSALLSDVISKPKWKHEKSGNVHVANKTLIPDIISIEDNQIAIYDAKYYSIKLNDSTVKNQPGVSDVTKQYLYELAYRDFANENNLLISKNAFLMPTDGDEEIHLGDASMDIFHALDGINFNSIKIILKPCEKMYDLYLNS